MCNVCVHCQAWTPDASTSKKVKSTTRLLDICFAQMAYYWCPWSDGHGRISGAPPPDRWPCFWFPCIEADELIAYHREDLVTSCPARRTSSNHPSSWLGWKTPCSSSWVWFSWDLQLQWLRIARVSFFLSARCSWRTNLWPQPWEAAFIEKSWDI